MDDWTYPTIEVDEVPPAQPALLDDDWRLAEARGVRIAQQADAAHSAEDEQVEARAPRDEASAEMPLLFVGKPGFGF